MNFGNWFGGGQTFNPQGVGQMANSGLNGSVGTSLAGMNVAESYALPTTTGPNYMGMIGMMSNMMPKDEGLQPLQMPPMAAPSAPQRQQAPLGPMYTPMNFQARPTAQHFNSLLGGVYGNS